MIISIHIPKTAGTSWRVRLKGFFGSRMLCDYGDMPGFNTPEVEARRAARAVDTRARRDQLLRDYDLIYGHFIADKYAGLFPNACFTAFFRDPYQQAVSHYQFLLRHPEIDNPAVKAFQKMKPTISEFVALLPNAQSTFLGQMALVDLAVVGLTEQYERSVAMFEAVIGRKLPPETSRENINLDRTGDAYEIDPAVRKAVDLHRAADVELYSRARERFGQLTARYDI